MCGYVDLIQNQFRTIMSSYDSDEEVAFQEDEVLWAKIRGYPWWPAFVDKIQLHPKKQEAQYTVFFFGDNTQYFSAKLGSSKLRKFIEFYTECFPKAKTNRRLMISIQLAEQKLKQNDQEVEIFQQLRNSMKNKKQKPVELVRVKSVKSEPNAMQAEEVLPSLIKSKTNMSRSKKDQIPAKQDIMEPQDESSESEEIVQRRSLRKKSSFKQQQKKQDKTKKAVAQQIYEQQAEDEQQPSKEPKQIVKAIIKNTMNEDQQQFQEGKSQKNSSEFVQDDESDGDYGGKIRSRRNASRGGPKRRGRPKKVDEQQDYEKSNRDNRSIANAKKCKPIHKVEMEEKEEPPKALSAANQKILKGVQQLLHNRDELITYLQSIKITPQNAKEILDMDVSNILQAGNVNERVRNILNLLKSALLLRYFPQDIKQSKSFQKLSKRKPSQIPAQSGKLQKSAQLSQCSADAQIRKKTLIKLEKFLKKHPDTQSNPRQIAVKIERYFFKIDSEVSNRYKTIAYNILSSLKDNKQGYKEVLLKLQAEGLND